MRKRLFLLSLSLLTYCVQAGFLPEEAYEKAAQQIIEKTRELGPLPHDMKQYLDERIADYQKIQVSPSYIPKAIKSIDPDLVNFFIMNHVDRDPAARFISQFINNAQELLAFHLRRLLGVRVGDAVGFEASYLGELKKVSEKEYSEKLDTLSNTDIDKIWLEESNNLAKVVLEKIR